MGEAKIRSTAFLEQHPNCVFCGGLRAAETTEHCPPRAMFEHRQWPVGFAFPACHTCNAGSRNQDLLVSMLARFDPIGTKRNEDGKSIGLMMRANNQFPNLFQEMRMSATEARRRNRELGIVPAPGQTHQDASPVKVPEALHHAVCTLASKLTKGVYYRETGKIFPRSGCMLLNWFTNAELVRHGKFQAFDLLKHIAGVTPPVERSGKSLNDQFEYKLSLSSDQELITLQARFGNAFGFVTFGCARSGPLEAIVERLRAQSSREGPFVVLQSLTLGPNDA
jgi:hypothetical protein